MLPWANGNIRLAQCPFSPIVLFWYKYKHGDAISNSLWAFSKGSPVPSRCLPKVLRTLVKYTQNGVSLCCLKLAILLERLMLPWANGNISLAWCPIGPFFATPAYYWSILVIYTNTAMWYLILFGHFSKGLQYPQGAHQKFYTNLVRYTRNRVSLCCL